MSYHEINIFADPGAANAKAEEHKAAGRKNTTITPAPGFGSVIIYDHTSTKPKVIFDKDGPPNFFLVESDGD